MPVMRLGSVRREGVPGPLLGLMTIWKVVVGWVEMVWKMGDQAVAESSG